MHFEELRDKYEKVNLILNIFYNKHTNTLRIIVQTNFSTKRITMNSSSNLTRLQFLTFASNSEPLVKSENISYHFIQEILR